MKVHVLLWWMQLLDEIEEEEAHRAMDADMIHEKRRELQARLQELDRVRRQRVEEENQARLEAQKELEEEEKARAQAESRWRKVQQEAIRAYQQAKVVRGPVIEGLGCMPYSLAVVVLLIHFRTGVGIRARISAFLHTAV